MNNDKLIEALNKAKAIIDDGVAVCDMMDREDAEQHLDAQEAIDEALAALQETHAVVPRQYEAAMASSGPRSGHSVEVQFKDREGALEFYSALKGLGSDWVQRQLDYIAARKKAAPQTEEPL